MSHLINKSHLKYKNHPCLKLNNFLQGPMRIDGRLPLIMRPIHIETGVQKFSTGSVLISFGQTRVICAANIEEKVPNWLQGRGQGWLTAEYAMLPGATHQRSTRESSRHGPNGRSQEIQRLIGRALRGVMDLKALGERTLHIDCDVLQADGGTRTASISGAYVATVLACRQLLKKNAIKTMPLREAVAAISVGMLKQEVFVDLCYEEDSTADVDLNLVMTSSHKMIEVQGTAEGQPFSSDELMSMVNAGKEAIFGIFRAQEQVLM